VDRSGQDTLLLETGIIPDVYTAFGMEVGALGIRSWPLRMHVKDIPKDRTGFVGRPDCWRLRMEDIDILIQ
jgi:hypothetical protein